VTNYRYPPELWTGTLTGSELIPVDAGSVYPTQLTTAQLAAGVAADLIGPRAAEAPAYTAATTADLTAANSQHGAAELWAILDGATTNHDGTASIARVVPGTTVTQVNGLAGYSDNANPNNITSGVGVGVAVGAYGVNRVDGTQTWMFDGILTDTGPSGPLGRLMQSEWDYKPLYATTEVNGHINVMDGPVQPTVADAFVAGSTYNGTTRLGRWNNGFRTYPAQVLVAFLADQSLAAGVPNSNSQPIAMNGTDGSSVQHTARLIFEGATTELVLDRSDGGSTGFVIANGNLWLNTGKGAYVNGSQVVTNRQGGWSAPTGSISRASLNTGTATLTNVVQALAALINDLIAHGLIGP
jgi:hypothetical protein